MLIQLRNSLSTWPPSRSCLERQRSYFGGITRRCGGPPIWASPPRWPRAYPRACGGKQWSNPTLAGKNVGITLPIQKHIDLSPRLRGNSNRLCGGRPSHLGSRDTWVRVGQRGNTVTNFFFPGPAGGNPDGPPPAYPPMRRLTKREDNLSPFFSAACAAADRANWAQEAHGFELVSAETR